MTINTTRLLCNAPTVALGISFLDSRRHRVARRATTPPTRRPDTDRAVAYISGLFDLVITPLRTQYSPQRIRERLESVRKRFCTERFYQSYGFESGFERGHLDRRIDQVLNDKVEEYGLHY